MANPDKNNVDIQAEEVKKDKKQNNANKKQTSKKSKQNDAPKKNLAKESISELKKVTWPTFGDVVKNTLVVLGIVLACTAALFLIDRVLSWLYQLLIDGSITNWWF